MVPTLRLTVACLLLTIFGGCVSTAEDSSSNTPPPSDRNLVKPDLPVATDARHVGRTALADLETARVDVDSPDWMVELDGSLWVRLDSGHVVRIDPSKRVVEADIPPAGQSQFTTCQGLGSSPGAVWSCGKGVLQRIDTASNQTVARIGVDISHIQGRFVWADSQIWVLAADGRSLIPIDTRTNDEGNAIPLDVTCSDLDVSETLVWASCPLDDQVIAVDVTDGTVIHRIGLEGATQVAVADELWVVFADGVAQIDPQELTVDAVYDVGDVRTAGVSVGDTAVWIRTDGGAFLLGINPKTHDIFARVTARDLPSGGNSMEIGGHIWASAYDDGVLVQLDIPAG